MSKDSLNLTDAQKAQMHELWKSQESQIEAVLTPEQLAQFKQATARSSPAS
jgi:Spy/CpxP family protein refolding chaperone